MYSTSSFIRTSFIRTSFIRTRLWEEKNGQNAPKMAFLPNCSKSAPQILLKFGIKVGINEYYDTMWWFMLAKFCFLSFQGVKWPHNAKKWHNWRGKCHPRLSEYSAYPNAIFGNWVQPVRINEEVLYNICRLYTSPSPRDLSTSRMPSSAWKK